MDKFSLYELLSFIAPGVAAIFLTNIYCQYVFGTQLIDFAAFNFYESIQYLLLALFIGILIHIIAIYFTEGRCKLFLWYKKLLHQPIKKIVVKDKYLRNIIPYLEENYQRINRSNNIQPEINLLFGTAYYFLEVNNKIDASKSFQGLYFWVRNTATLIMIAFFVMLIFSILDLASLIPAFNTVNALLFLVVLLFCFVLLIYPAQWLRKKMVVRIFVSYYSCLIHNLTKD